MAKTELLLGEAYDFLKTATVELLTQLDRIKADPKLYEALKKYNFDHKQLKMDQMYRLKRPRNEDDLIKNAIDHEYYAGRIASIVILLQVIENAAGEIERRERKAK